MTISGCCHHLHCRHLGFPSHRRHSILNQLCPIDHHPITKPDLELDSHIPKYNNKDRGRGPTIRVARKEKKKIKREDGRHPTPSLLPLQWFATTVDHQHSPTVVPLSSPPSRRPNYRPYRPPLVLAAERKNKPPLSKSAKTNIIDGLGGRDWWGRSKTWCVSPSK